MRVNRTVLALGALWVASLLARPALAQQETRRGEQRDARASWHEARRREAEERRAALLEWHRARRAGLVQREAPRASLAERHPATTNAPTLRTTALERGNEPSIIALPESRVRVLGAAGAQEHGRDDRGSAREGFGRGLDRFDHDPDRFGRGRDRFGHGREWRGFGRDPWGPWAVPHGSFGLPYGFEDLVCVARVRDPYLAGPWKFGPYGRPDRIHLRATCLPSFGFGYGWAGAPYGPFGPYGQIGDPLLYGVPNLYGYPYRAAPLPAPHRFSHRFFPPESALPWAAGDAWLPDGDDGYELEELFR